MADALQYAVLANQLAKDAVAPLNQMAAQNYRQREIDEERAYREGLLADKRAYEAGLIDDARRFELSQQRQARFLARQEEDRKQRWEQEKLNQALGVKRAAEQEEIRRTTATFIDMKSMLDQAKAKQARQNVLQALNSSPKIAENINALRARDASFSVFSPDGGINPAVFNRVKEDDMAVYQMTLQSLQSEQNGEIEELSNLIKNFDTSKLDFGMVREAQERGVILPLGTGEDDPELPEIVVDPNNPAEVPDAPGKGKSEGEGTKPRISGILAGVKDAAGNVGNIWANTWGVIGSPATGTYDYLFDPEQPGFREAVGRDFTRSKDRVVEEAQELVAPLPAMTMPPANPGSMMPAGVRVPPANPMVRPRLPIRPQGSPPLQIPTYYPAGETAVRPVRPVPLTQQELLSISPAR
jgi:hypothetical protein